MMKEKFERSLSILKVMNERQAKFFTVTKQIEEKAKRNAVEFGTVAPVPEMIPAYKKESEAAVEELTNLKMQLYEALGALEVAHEQKMMECNNLSGVELSNILRVIDLTGKDLHKMQAVSLCDQFKGDYIALETIAAAFRRVGNELAEKAVARMIPNIPGICDDIRKMCDPSNLIPITKADTAKMSNMLVSAADKLGIKFSEVEMNEFYELEEERWRAEAGL